MDHAQDTPIAVDLGRIAQDLQIRRVQVEAVAQLLDEGNAVPFIARYRRERTGGLPEGLIREIQARIVRGRDLAGRKQAILKTIETQGRLTEELAEAIRGADGPKKLDDLYLPYKPRKRTKGMEAREQGLEPLALRIWDRDETLTDLEAAAAEFVDPAKGLDTPEKVLDGVRRILAESISDLAHVREAMRRVVWKLGKLATTKAPNLPEGKGQDYRDYFQYAEPVGHVPPHRTLAINRGEKEGVLKTSLEVPRAEVERVLLGQLPLEDHPHREIFTAATLEAMQEILLPAMEREVKRDLSEVAERHAVEVFARNLRSLLLQPPIDDQVVLAIDPSRKGCKLAVLDPSGKLLDHAVVHPFPGATRRYEAKQKIKELVAQHGVGLVAIGNGTACRETEELIAEVIAEGTHFHENPGVPFPGAAQPAAEAASEEPPSEAAAEGSALEASGTEASAEEAGATAGAAPSETTPDQTDETAGANGDGGEDAGPERSGDGVEELASAPRLDPANVPPIAGGSGADGPDGEPGGEPAAPTSEPIAEMAAETPIDTVPPPAPESGGEATPRWEEPRAESVEGEAPPVEAVGVVETGRSDGETPAAEAYAPGEPMTEPAPAGDAATRPVEAVAGSEQTTSEAASAEPPPPVEAGTAEAGAERGAAAGGRPSTPRPVPAPGLTQPPKGSGKPKPEREPRPPKPKTPPPPPAPHEADPLLAKLAYLVVNEAGTNLYSSSALAKEELPDYDAELRGTISIGRRLQDPLAELVKVDPQSIGVGQYQHDVNPKVLKQALDQVVESCVNLVGVDLNRAGVTLLGRVAGLNELLARRIVEYRKEHGPFRSREQLRQVEGISDGVYAQAAGFVKVRGGDEPLDRTWVHPEQYELARRLLEGLELTPAAILEPETLETLRAKFDALDVPARARELGVSPTALGEVMDALAQPDRDPREDSPKPIFKRGLLRLEDLEPGTELKGTVLNVVNFGAFVDIGLKDSGLVHISQLANRYVKSPHEVVSVGDVVAVWVLTVDKDRKRVSLTMIPPGTERPRPDRGPRGGGERGPGGRPERGGPRPPRREGGARPDRGGPGGSSGERSPGGAVETPTNPRPGMNRIPGPPLRLQQGGRGGRPGMGRGGPGRGGAVGRPQGGARSESSASSDTSSAPKPRPKPPAPAPLPKEAVTGNSPLRSFGQLKQLFELRQKGPEEQASGGEAAGVPAPAEAAPPDGGKGAPPRPEGEGSTS